MSKQQENLCPACGQTLPDRRGRICSECQLPIGSHHKFYFVGSRVRHRDCDDPKLYKKASEPAQAMLTPEDGPELLA